MKYFLFLILALVPSFAMADDKTHLAAAENLIDLVDGQQVMRDAFVSTVSNLIEGDSRISGAEADDMKKALIDWFDTDIKWEELRGQMADIYVKAFTEDELNQLLAFYKTPLGKKTLEKLPQVMNQAMVVGQDYAKAKQASLMARLDKVEEKYNPAKVAPSSSGSGSDAKPAADPSAGKSAGASTSVPATSAK